MRIRPNMEAQELYVSIVNDFESAWNAVASTRDASGRGNFMFGRQALSLLEWACRLCASDGSGRALSELSNALLAIEPRYFTHLPGPCASQGREFSLPSHPGTEPGSQLLWAMFDLMRHGHAHQYQQITAALTDGYWVMSLTGAEYGETLAKVAAARPGEHLGVGRVEDTIFLLVRPDVMFLDFKRAMETSGLLGRDDLRLVYLARGGDDRRGLYAFSGADLERFLGDGGHVRVGIRGVTDR